jgi:hypothetical protein
VQNEFRIAYEQAVAEALKILGQPVASIIMLYVKEKYSIRLGETSDNPKVLTDALQSTLDGGTRIIQRRVLRLLYNKIGIEPSFAITINFEEKVLSAKKEFEKKYINSKKI